MRGKTKIPPLKVLVRQAKQDAPEQLVKALNMADVDGNTALHWAACAGDTKLMAWLASAGADVDARNNSEATALHAAAGNGQAYAVEWLLANGADATAVNDDGETAAQYATRKARPDLARIIQAAAARVEALERHE